MRPGVFDGHGEQGQALARWVVVHHESLLVHSSEGVNECLITPVEDALRALVWAE